MIIKAIFIGLCLLAAVASAADTKPAAVDPPSGNIDLNPTQLTEGSQLMRFIKSQWNDFRGRHKRTYSTALEAAKRFKIFVQNVRATLRHNRLFKQGTVTFQQATSNPFADLTSAEFLQQRSMRNISSYENPSYDRVQDERTSRRVARAALPWAVNWVAQGAVSAVQEQGQCASCWAFAVAGAVEAWQWRKTGRLTPLSPQQLLDCTGPANSCDVGYGDMAFEYTRLNYGLSPASAYPYYGRQGQCYNVYRAGTIRSFDITEFGDEQDLMRAVALYGPVTVAIDITPSTFQFYSGGVYQEPQCTHEYTNHMMLLVGYGRDEVTGLDYWLVKNSWGEQWGEQGYARIIRYARNNEHCGIANLAVYVTA